VILDFVDELNWWAILVSALAALVIGFVWFAPPALGGVWARNVSRYAGIPENEVLAGSIVAPTAKWFLTMLVNAIVLALAVEAVGADSALDGVVLGIALWLGIGATLSTWPPIFARMPWQWWLLNNGAFLLMQVVMGAILGAWQ
jgi:hypothetical protein